MRWLYKFQAFLGDKQRDNDSSRVSQDFVNQIRDFTFDIEDAFDEFMFNVPHHTHTTTTHRFAHEWKYHVRSELNKLCSCRDDIRNRIQSQNELKRLLNQVRPGQEASSSSQETSLTHNIVEEEGMVDFQSRHQDRLVNEVWRKEDFNAFANALPRNSKGSRIIVTTQKIDVADPNQSNIHRMGKLHPDEAWNLFCMKAFRDRNGVCPDELQSSSLEIVERCEGLPLAIAFVGTSLSKKQPVLHEWNRFCKSLDFGTNLSVMRRILQPSFEDLQDNHKSCLLYLSLFPKGYSIKRERLIRSWIAEGFVKKIGGQTLEDIAETYLNILIERHLVQVSELEIDGQVRSCRVSNPIHEILVSMSRGGSFSKVLEFNDDDTDSSERVRRLSFQNGITKFRCNKNWSKVRSCFIFGQQDDADNSSSSRRSLRHRTFRKSSSSGTAAKTEKDYVYSDCNMEKPPVEIHRLYLKGRLDLLPRFINSKLQNLVKVVLKGSKLPANAMPVQPFEALPSLMELEMVEYYTGEELVFRAGKFNSLKRLHIEEFVELSMVVVEDDSMPKLEKLTICKCKNLKSASPGIFNREPPVEFSHDEMNEEFISNLQRGKKGKNFDEQGLETGIGSSQYHQAGAIYLVKDMVSYIVTEEYEEDETGGALKGRRAFLRVRVQHSIFTIKAN
ncbi:hypothetical protein FEM48_Zijuj01G0094900 [Ziziphus jujuba var. spinosa]|uniref:Disease resistance protein RPM1-like n=1 Tax=Ziziphus jujuba var. spinosa TaxID=714518 RepID=A0A978W0G3_ZIZJJ|nr:hypothetical protein FEM48_Zijuj01G0094900 [Ziziphus jujuba var. spinosa]